MAPRILRAAALLLLLLTPAAEAARPSRSRSRTLSNRADLVSDGQALVRITLPKGASAPGLSVTVGGAT